jgi:KaiC/GvpD/RAD55 family RecA-like ATPase
MGLVSKVEAWEASDGSLHKTKKAALSADDLQEFADWYHSSAHEGVKLIARKDRILKTWPTSYIVSHIDVYRWLQNNSSRVMALLSKMDDNAN